MENNNYRSSNNGKLNGANQAEILRSHQKDGEFVNLLYQQLNDLLVRFGIKKPFGFLQSDTAAKLIYFIFTSGIGNQTLGEEYTGIVQAHLKERKIPSLTLRVISAILECFGEQMLLKLLEKLQRKINHPQSNLKPSAKVFLSASVHRLGKSLPVLILLHRALFYLSGRYYTLGRRATGIDLAKVYGKSSSAGINWALRLLGLITLGQAALRFWHNERTLINDESEELMEDVGNSQTAGKRCQLCLDHIPTTATPCGHLFCWNCIADWLRTRPYCPLCREHVLPHRIIPLINL